MSKACIVEVGLRDGLQNESQVLSLRDRLGLIKKLSGCGLKRIEIGSFVSPRWVPQMKCVPELAKKTIKLQSGGGLPKNISYCAFVPNVKGFEQASDCGLREVSTFISCTESFSKKNLNMSVKDSFKNLHIICQKARALKIRVRVYLSAAVACPYEGKVSAKKAARLCRKIFEAGGKEVSLSDTIGAAGPVEIRQLLQEIKNQNLSVKKVALHLHDTRGLALACACEGLKAGVRIFDSSLGGVGGCPYAPGASGNVATEDLAYLLEKMCFQTGVRMEQLIPLTRLLEKKLSRALPARLAQAHLIS